jgi:hypothetical protein
VHRGLALCGSWRGGNARSSRCGEQQVPEVAREDADRLLLLPLAQPAEEVEHHRKAEFGAPGPAGNVAEPEIARRVALDAERRGDHCEQCAATRGRNFAGLHA